MAEKYSRSIARLSVSGTLKLLSPAVQVVLPNDYLTIKLSKALWELLQLMQIKVNIISHSDNEIIIPLVEDVSNNISLSLLVGREMAKLQKTFIQQHLHIT